MPMLSRRDVRRIVVRAQWLHSERPIELVELVRCIQTASDRSDGCRGAERSPVARSRLGSVYDPADLDDALQKREPVELGAPIRPGEDIVLYRAKMAAWPGHGPLRSWQQFRRDWVKANDACR